MLYTNTVNAEQNLAERRIKAEKSSFYVWYEEVGSGYLASHAWVKPIKYAELTVWILIYCVPCLPHE